MIACFGCGWIVAIGCCLSRGLGPRLMLEDLRGRGQLYRMSMRLYIKAGISVHTIIRVDQVTLHGILIVVFVGIRGSCSAGHHGGHCLGRLLTVYRPLIRLRDRKRKVELVGHNAIINPLT